MTSIAGKIVWITGASSGIGEALAYAFAKERASLVLSARNIEKLELVRKKCLEYTSGCKIQKIDLLDVEHLSDVVLAVQEQTGGVDILVNNAGRSQRSWAIETPFENDRQIMELNFFAVVRLTKLILPKMLGRKSGHLVVVSSITGKFGFPMRTAYSASKHALQGYFEALRAELTDHNIKVTIVSPGRIQTNISLNALTETGEAHSKMDDGQANGMDVGICARKIVKAVKKERKDILVGRKELLMVYIRRFLPALFYKLSTKIKN